MLNFETHFGQAINTHVAEFLTLRKCYIFIKKCGQHKGLMVSWDMSMGGMKQNGAKSLAFQMAKRGQTINTKAQMFIYLSHENVCLRFKNHFLR